MRVCVIADGVGGLRVQHESLRTVQPSTLTTQLETCQPFCSRHQENGNCFFFYLPKALSFFRVKVWWPYTNPPSQRLEHYNSSKADGPDSRPFQLPVQAALRASDHHHHQMFNHSWIRPVSCLLLTTPDLIAWLLYSHLNVLFVC